MIEKVTIAPKVIIVGAGKMIDIKDCIDINSLTITGYYENNTQSKKYYLNDINGIYNETTQELSLPVRESVFMPPCYIIEYTAQGDFIKITSDKKIDEDIECHVLFS